MRTDEFQSNNLFKIVGLVVMVILFVMAFILLINKHTANLGDVIDVPFSYETIKGKVLVVKDQDAIYPRFFVVFFDEANEHYIIHNFNYYETESQFDLDYHRYLNSVIDYNMNKNILRIKYYDGIGSYSYVKDNINRILELENVYVYE